MAIEIRSERARSSSFEANEQERRSRRRMEYDRLAPERDGWRARIRAYYAAIERLGRFVVPEGASVLEVGCGTGDLLAALKPREGVGLDISPRLVEIARGKHPGLDFIVGDAEALDASALEGRTFDYVVLSDVVGALTDVWAAFRALRRVCNARTVVLATYSNFVSSPLLRLGEKVGLKMPIEQQNW